MRKFMYKVAAAGLMGAAFAAPPALAQQAANCQNFDVALYFSAYDSDLTPQAERVIEEASQQLRRCAVAGVSVNVLSEEAHTDEDAALLSEARANSVLQSIMDHGIDASTFKADFSRAEAAAPSAQPMIEPMARRVSVSFAVLPQAGV